MSELRVILSNQVLLHRRQVWAENWGFEGDEILVGVTDPQNVFGQGGALHSW